MRATFLRGSRLRRTRWTPILCCVLSWAGPSYALQKCTMPDGRVEYTDKACGIGATAQQPQLVDNSTDGRVERAQVQRDQAERDGLWQSLAAPYRGPVVADRSNTYTCRLALKNYQTTQSSITKPRSADTAPPPDLDVIHACGIEYARIHATPPAALPQPVSVPQPQPRPAMITSCDSRGCWDNQGGRYSGGRGGTYFSSNGQTCQKIGALFQCN